MTKILIVEDEETIRKFEKINLEMEGFEVLEAASGEEGIDLAKNENPDIVLLDVMLPGIDGFEVCRQLRAMEREVGIIMVTAKNQDIDKIEGLEAGSDDYISKPFNPRELTLRIKSLERRLRNINEPSDDKVLEVGQFKLDKASRKFYKDGKEIDLTPTEYAVMVLFLENQREAISRDEILDRVWGEDFIGDSKIVDVNIRRLRTKIEADSSKPAYIKTVWGVGYIWEP
ncbi:response regulator transcription factor [Neofamilia massiliensis]|uniref:response regulator transcription factor n=1 Tax=Neofamilia massiliensis TaxID=1673724 RepID=UPI0006BB7CC8|nr:response regulator transcription factor [Neofamilia massiliensis]